MSSSATLRPPKALETDPEMPESTAVVPAPAATPASMSTAKSFLGLPLEVRQGIYSYFAHLPAVSKDDSTTNNPAQYNRVAIARTRFYLQLVCRQINLEWTPTFYKTTAIAIHGNIRPYENFSFTPETCFWDTLSSLRRAPSRFSKDFLDQGYSHIFPYVDRLHCTYESACRLEKGAVLQKATEVLAALEEIVFSAPWNYSVRVEKPQQIDWQYLWGQLGTNMTLLENAFRTWEQSTLSGWSLTRRMRYVQRESRCDINEVQLVLRKSSTQQTLMVKDGKVDFPSS
ncbi:hypothetical protein H2200_000139 [Cladophialophora chaetospira]|uniref:Uncharacterized protein n=1 Tax=Cladophialophora chaetospira TaxID=386627 RepID=A0AA39CQP2_9EURO|nr:hypothetical protein H2200_000139 [Cladophialophora chaetospira]